MIQITNTHLAGGAALLALSLAPVSPAWASAHHQPKTKSLHGVVVHENRSAHTFVVAEPSGRLDAVHGHRLPVGDRVRLKARKLANGTFKARKEQVVSHAKARTVEIEGVVSSSDPAADQVVVSGAGSSIPVTTDTSTAGDAQPPVSEAVDATVDVETDGSVVAEDVQDAGQSSAFRVEGKVLAIDVQARTLTISGDDDGGSDSALTVALPDTFDMSAFAVGDCVELTVTQNADGSLTAVQSFGDGNAREADNHGSHGEGRGGPGGDQSDGHQDGDQQDQSGSGDQQQSGSGDQSGSADQSGSGDQQQSGSVDSGSGGSGGSGSDG